MRVLPRAAYAAIFLLAAFRAFAAIHPPAEPFTPKERAQGYTDRAILAKPRAGFAARAAAEESVERVRVRETFPLLENLRVIEVDSGETVDAAIARLQATGRYEFVEPDHLMFEDAIPNDPSYPSQWSLNNTGQLTGSTVGVDINAQAAWDTLRDAPDVVVATIDSGVRIDHEDIAPNLWRNPAPTFGDIHGARFIRGSRSGDVTDDRGHGTHVAGIIAAAGDNGVATAGIAWRTQLMVLKNGGADGGASTSDSAACLNYAIAHGAKIVNCSFGGTNFSQALFTVLRAARDAGVIVVCSAGNTGANNDTTPHYPSSYLLDNIVAVGSSGPTDAPRSSSNYGMSVDLYAPGVSIVSTSFTGTTGVSTRSGTSMAAPHVTGALVLLRARFPNDTYRQLINRLLRGTEQKTSLVSSPVLTNARLNLQHALSITSNRPANDDYLKRYLIVGSSFSMRGNNRDATTETGEPAHAGVSTTGTLWWQWISSINGPVTVDTNGSDFDTTLAIYNGTASAPITGLTPLVSDDDGGPGQTSRVTFTAAEGTPYFFAVGGKAGTEGYAQLNLSAAPENDNFAAAATLTGESAQHTERNVSAALEPGEPGILGYTGGASLWYKWTAPRTARYQVSAFTFEFDALLAVYTGSALDNLVLVSAGDDTDAAPGLFNTDSRCTINAIAGMTYYFQVDSKDGSNRGALTVTVTDSQWQFSTDGGAITSAPSIGRDGTIYVGTLSPDRRLYAVAPDGSLRWTYAAGGTIDISSVAIGADGTLYLGAADGRLTALTSAGAVLWERDFGAGNAVTVSPAIGADRTLYTHARDGYLYALDPSAGATKWRYNVNSTNTFSSGVIAPDGTIYQGSDDASLYALNPDGTLKWRYNAPGVVLSTPSLDASGNIYFCAYSPGRVISLSSGGIERWIYSGLANQASSSPTLSADGSTLYVGSNRFLYALDSANGAARWTYTMGGTVFASTPAVDSNGVIYIGNADGKLYAITAGGSLKRTWDTAQRITSSPVIFGTKLYIGSRDAKLYAFDIGASAAGGPWPQYRQNVRHSGRAVVEPLAVTAPPETQSATEGQEITIRVAATGEGPLAYQWFKDGTPISSATGSSYTIAGVSAASAGNYTVVINGPQGAVTSAAAAIELAPFIKSEIGRLVNLSIRSHAGTGENTLIVGLGLGGAGTTGTKALLIRGVGPTLAEYDVAGALADPMMTVFSGATPVAHNDNWTGGFDFQSVGAFGFTGAAPRDAALYQDALSSGGYSIVITGKDGGTGVALAEIYDATPAGSFSTTTARLVNLSARAQVGTGDNILVAGFAIGGSGPVRVLIRAAGPILSEFGLSGALPDPRLVIYNASSTTIAENDNWNGTSDLKSAFDSVAAFPFSADDSRDAALVVTLQPGTYTAQISGVGNTEGVALVEVYELP